MLEHSYDHDDDAFVLAVKMNICGDRKYNKKSKNSCAHQMLSTSVVVHGLSSYPPKLSISNQCPGPMLLLSLSKQQA